MTEMTRSLIDVEDESLFRGNILRVPGKYPYEEFVDFMIFDTQSEDRRYALIVTSGYKAGLILVYLPQESEAAGGGVNLKWLVSNWNKWIYPECDVSDVTLISRYDVVGASHRL